MTSRACQIATKVRMDTGAPLTVDARRTAAMAHACCEGRGCGCGCHRAELELTAYGNDPRPLITAYPDGAVALEAVTA